MNMKRSSSNTSGTSATSRKKSRHDYFEVYPTEQFNYKFPFFRQPSEVGSFCHDERRNFVHDRSQLKYFISPPNPSAVSFDLSDGYDIFMQKDESKKEYLDDLLRWVQLNQHKFAVEGSQSNDNSLHTDFICWRGLLTKLLCTPYENREGWKIAVTLFNGTWYLCEFETEQRASQRAKMTEREKEMSYWGFKFEQYVTADNADEVPDTRQPVNNNNAFCSVVRSRLNKHSLVFGGEVDCIEPGQSKKYVELKTSRQIEHQNQDRNFKRFKLIKWWAQSFLIGIPKIICGFRDDSGVVNSLQPFSTQEIPKMCSQSLHNCWEPSVCFNFCDQVMQFMKSVVEKDDPRIAYVFEWEPRSGVKWTEQATDSQYTFLPQWYYQPKTI